MISLRTSLSETRFKAEANRACSSVLAVVLDGLVEALESTSKGELASSPRLAVASVSVISDDAFDFNHLARRRHAFG